jgi:hypothetical protein
MINYSKINFNKFLQILLIIFIIIWWLFIFYGLYNIYYILIMLITYSIIGILLIFNILKNNNWVILFIKIIFSLLFLIWWPLLSILWVAFWALYNTPEWIFMTILYLYLINYYIFWFYLITYKINKTRNFVLIILLNIFWTIGVFYWIIYFIFRESFFI